LIWGVDELIVGDWRNWIRNMANGIETLLTSADEKNNA
jgi:hypothetical protein